MRRSKTFERIVALIIILAVLEFITILLGTFTDLTYTESFRIIFGSLYVLFLPGLTWSFVFFPHEKKSIDIIERLALSFALSIAIVPLTIFYLNLLGLPITSLTSFFTILVLILIGLGIISFRKNKF